MRKCTFRLCESIICGIFADTRESRKRILVEWGALPLLALALTALAILVGGYAPPANFDDFWEYHPSTNSWTQKSNLPLAVRVPGVKDGTGGKRIVKKIVKE